MSTTKSMSGGKVAVGETNVTLVGNVVSDLSRRVLDDGGEVVSFRVVSNERRFDKQSGDWVDGRKFSARVNCWRRLAVNVYSSISKGDPVLVVGRLHTREYEVDGSLRYSTELDAYAVGPNLSRATAVVHRTRGGGSGEVEVLAAVA